MKFCGIGTTEIKYSNAHSDQAFQPRDRLDMRGLWKQIQWHNFGQIVACSRQESNVARQRRTVARDINDAARLQTDNFGQTRRGSGARRIENHQIDVRFPMLCSERVLRPLV